VIVRRTANPDEELETERRNLEVARQAVLSERAGIKKALEGVWELTGKLQQQDAMAAGLMGMGGLPIVQNAVQGVMQDAGMAPPQPTDVLMPPDGFGDQGPFGVDDNGAIITGLT